MEMHQENKRTISLSSAKIFRCLVEMLSNLSILYDISFYLWILLHDQTIKTIMLFKSFQSSYSKMFSMLEIEKSLYFSKQIGCKELVKTNFMEIVDPFKMLGRLSLHVLEKKSVILIQMWVNVATVDRKYVEYKVYIW